MSGPTRLSHGLGLGHSTSFQLPQGPSHLFPSAVVAWFLRV